MASSVDVTRFKIAYLEEVGRGLDKQKDSIAEFLDSGGQICDRGPLIKAMAEQSTRLMLHDMTHNKHYGLPAHVVRSQRRVSQSPLEAVHAVAVMDEIMEKAREKAREEDEDLRSSAPEE